MENTLGIVIWLICVWGCAALFTGIGIYAGKSDKPMHFWSGTTVNPKVVKNIYGYNQAMKKLWMIYSVPFYACGLLYFYKSVVAVILLLLVSTLGIAGLIYGYFGIEKKYVDKGLSAQDQMEEQVKKNAKTLWISMIFTIAVFMVCGILMFTGNVKTKVNKEGIQIKATYWGTTNIAWDDVEQVSLKEDFDSGSKTGGFNSAILELGNYTNKQCGKYVVYRYTACKSCVLITTNQGDIGVNAATHQETEALYDEIKRQIIHG